MVFAAKTRGERILEAGAPFPQHAALTLQCSRDGTSVQNFEKLLLEAIAREHGRSLPDNRRAHRAEALADFLVLRVLDDLPLADASEKVRRIRNAEVAGSEVDVARHGVLRGVAEAVAPPGTADISYRAFSNSDFPKLVQDSLQVLLDDAFQKEEQPYLPISRVIEASDFRPHHIVKAAVSIFAENAPGAPVEIGGAASSEETVTLKTFAQAIDISRQLLVDDHVGALQAAAQGVAAAAVRTIASRVFTVLQSNPVMGDGITLFHASHLNTGAAGLDTAGLGATLARIRNQTSLTGERMALVPTHLLLPTASEATGRALLGTFGQNGADIEPLFSGFLTPSTTYYALSAPGITIAALDGRLAPSIVEQVPLGMAQGTRYITALDFNVLAHDFRVWARATA
jgi:hypothetical protein